LNGVPLDPCDATPPRWSLGESAAAAAYPRRSSAGARVRPPSLCLARGACYGGAAMGADRDDAPFTADEIGRAAEILEAVAGRRGLLAGVEGGLRRRLLVAAGRLSRPERVEQRELAKAFRRRDREERKAADGALLDATGIRTARRAPVFQ